MAERKLPSAHAEAVAAQAKAIETSQTEAKRQRERLAACFNAVLKTEEGREVWAWFFNRCGYSKPILMSGAGEVLALRTDCLAAQREVYRDARELVAPELLSRAEFYAERRMAFPEGGVKKKEG